MPRIELTDETFAALQARAEPLVDTTEDVILRLLEDVTTDQETTPDDHPGRCPAGSKTPKAEFYEPILQVLRDAGGELPTATAVDRVGDLMADVLNGVDRQKLSSGEIRWRNTVRFARYDLVQQGRLDSNAPHGVWRIAEDLAAGAIHFPWSHVEASRRDRELQRSHSPEDAIKRYQNTASECPGCSTSPQDLTWAYFNSPPSTWRNLCGREGWLTICDSCDRQVDFFTTLMS